MKNMYTCVFSRWLFMLLLLGSQTLLAQTAPTIQWQKFTGGLIKQAANGDIILGSGQTISRLNQASGQSIWTTSLPAGFDANIVYDLLVSRDGSIVTLSKDRANYYLAKLDASGTILWNKSFAGATQSGDLVQTTIRSIAQAADGGYVAVSSSTYGRNGAGTVLYKFDASGSNTSSSGVSYPYSNTIRPISFGNKVIATPDGGYLVVGATNSGAEPSSLGWAAKLDKNLKQVWTDRYNFASSFTDVIPNPFDTESFIATGQSADFKATTTLVISPTQPGTNNTAGTYRPSLRSAVLVYSISDMSTISIDPQITTSGSGSYEVMDAVDQRSGDIRIVSFGPNNQTRWTKILGGSFVEVPRNVITTATDNLLLTGLTSSSDGDVQGKTGGTVSGWLVKLVPGTPLTLMLPSYDCDRGSITFTTSGGDGSPITFSAPGIMRSSATSNSGTVEQGLRNDPKTITITATQSGYSTSYVFDLNAYCTGIITPTLREPIPDQSRPVNVQIVSNIIPISSYFNGVPAVKSFRPLVNYRASGLPPGMILFDSSNESQQLAYIGGTPTTTGTYSVTVAAYVSNAAAPQPSVSTTFRITITDDQVVTPPPSGSTLTLTQPTYDCSTGAITFNTTGGNNNPITFSAPGITRSSATSNTGFVEQGLRNDPKVITITAMQSGQTTTYSFDLKAACNGTTPTPTMHPDMQPLVDLYNATNGPSWKNKTNWLTGNSPCNWFGVSCNADGRVIGINLGYNNLNGTLPSSLGNLSELQRFIIFTEPLVSGTLPASLGNLSKLQLLEIEYTQISGSIPESLGNLKQLTQLFLAKNELSGSVPESLGNLSSLKTLYLFGNQLTGNLPNSFASLPQIQSLHLYANRFSGCIPSAYTALCGKDVQLNSNVGLPGGGDFAAFCANPSQNCGPNKLLTLTQPTYNCSTGAITFNLVNGDGSPVTYTAPGIIRSSVTSNSGTVEQGLRNDPKTITITAIQSGYSTSFSFNLKAFCSGTTPTPTPPVTGNALSLSAYVGNCSSQTPLIAFRTTGGDGTPITFSAPGVVRRSLTDSSGTIETGLRNDPKPITISALQSGKSVSYVVDLPKLCDPTPTVGTPIDNLTLTVGQRVDQTIAQSNYNFYDPYVSTDITGNYSRASSIRYSSTKLPDSLYAQNFTRGDDATYFRLFGKPTTAGVFPITVTATVNGRSVSASFTITVLSANTQPVTPPSTGGTLTLTQPTYNCSTGAFIFNYTGGNGSPVEFQAAGITGWTTNPNQFVDKDSRTANDVKPFTLMARQNGQMVTYTWDLKAACGRSARLAATEAGQSLELTVKGNPVGNTAIVEIRGAEGQALQLDLLNASGRVIEQRHIEQAGAVDEQRFDLQRQPTGLLFLRAQSGQQKQTVKLIKQ